MLQAALEASHNIWVDGTLQDDGWCATESIDRFPAQTAIVLIA
jgi:hypothetical protein